MKKNALFILLIIFLVNFAIIGGCKKYESVIPSADTIVPVPTPVPDNTWMGNGPFFVKVSGNTIMLLFVNSYVLDPHAPFYEYKIGNGAWSAPIAQATPYSGHALWGLGTIPMTIVIPEDATIYVRFGSGPNYANITTSMFNVGGVICFGLPQINH